MHRPVIVAVAGGDVERRRVAGEAPNYRGRQSGQQPQEFIASF